jgi:hypothetical protein
MHCLLNQAKQKQTTENTLDALLALKFEEHALINPYAIEPHRMSIIMYHHY